MYSAYWDKILVYEKFLALVLRHTSGCIPPSLDARPCSRWEPRNFLILPLSEPLWRSKGRLMFGLQSCLKKKNKNSQAVYSSGKEFPSVYLVIP